MEIKNLRIAADNRKQQKAEIDRLNIQIEDLKAKLDQVRISVIFNQYY